MKKHSPPSKKHHKASVSAAGKHSPTYKKTVLPNGLRIVSEHISHVRSVSAGVWIDIGSRDEDPSLRGISHFIEHMVFKGTKNRSVREISQSIESVGGYLNAFTSKEHTCFYARVLDDYSDLAMDVLSDLTQNPTFPEKELEKEKGVVIEELRNAEDDPDDIIHDYFEKSIYGSHPMGSPVIGTEQTLRSMKRENLVDYRGNHYVPQRIVVAAAGNIDHDRLVDLTAQYFAGTKNGVPAGERKRPSIQKPERVELEKPIQQAHVCLGTSAYSIRSKHRYPLLVLNTLLGDGMSSRLFQNIREKYGFAYNVYSFVNMLSDTGTFGAYIGTDKSHVQASIELIHAELEKLRNKPVSKAEVQRTKAQLKGSMMLSLESIPNRMMRLGSSELYFNELTALDSIIRQIDAVSIDEIQELAKELFAEGRFSRVVFLPGGKREETERAMASAARKN